MTDLRLGTGLSQREATLFVLGELRFTLAQAKGYIGLVSKERGDMGQQLVDEIEERLSEVNALRTRLRRDV